MHTFKTLCILDVLFYIAYSARYSLFVLMCRKTHITHSLLRTFKCAYFIPEVMCLLMSFFVMQLYLYLNSEYSDTIFQHTAFVNIKFD